MAVRSRLFLIAFAVIVLVNTSQLATAKPDEDSEKKCFYEVLKVSRDASKSQIKKAYRKLSLQFHPDKNPGKEEEVKVKFMEVSRAYEVLGNPELKERYDRFGHAAVEEGGPGAGGPGGFGGDPFEMFQAFFGGGGGGPEGFFGMDEGGPGGFFHFGGEGGPPEGFQFFHDGGDEGPHGHGGGIPFEEFFGGGGEGGMPGGDHGGFRVVFGGDEDGPEGMFGGHDAAGFEEFFGAPRGHFEGGEGGFIDASDFDGHHGHHGHHMMPEEGMDMGMFGGGGGERCHMSVSCVNGRCTTVRECG